MTTIPISIRVFRLAAIVASVVVWPLHATTTVEVTILHTTDIHGQCQPTTDYQGTKRVGGIYQLASVAAGQRKAHPAALIVDNGDTVQGTIGTFLDKGASFMGCMNALGVSVMNIGNHEFDWGIEALGAHLARASGAVVCANLQWCGASPSPFATISPYVIREAEGMRIAFIGLTHPKVPFWSLNELIKGAVIEPPVQALQRVMPLVRAEHPDAVVLLAHMGAYADQGTLESWLEDALRQFPDLDVVIGGHTHQCVTNMMVGDTLFTQAGYHGIMLGEVTLVFDAATRFLKDKRAELHGVGPDADLSAALKALNAAADARETAEARMTVCAIDGVLGGNKSLTAETPDQTLICEAIAAASSADVVFHGSFGSSFVVNNRTMTMFDLFIFVPYENRIVTMELTPGEIGHVLEELMGYWGTPQYAFPYGVRAVVDCAAAKGKRVKAIRTAAGHPLDDTKRYRVAFNSYMAASGGMRYMAINALFNRASSQATVSTITTRDAVAQFLRARATYTPHVVTTIEVKGPVAHRARRASTSSKKKKP